MASSIDERVVQLTLDNKQFNKASDETIDSLEKLKKTLEFEGAIDSFDQVEKGIKKVDFSPIENGLNNLGHSFTILDTITDTIFRNITNRVLDLGERTIKSLTTDQITTGWEKYAEQTGAVQTIMAATAQQFDDTAIQMEVVNEQLEKLTWFTDETSHKFNDMVGGIGKFTANNIDLETSVKAMEGIATWASLSGANTNEASRAIYNLAQAISVGSVKLLDWRSIQTANMATAEFNQTVIETAMNMGTVAKVGEDMYKVLGDSKNVYSSVSLFSEGLQKAWFTSDILLASLDKYGGYADRLHDFVEETDILTATAMNFVDNYVDGTLDMQEAMDATGLDAEELTKWLEELGSEEYALGRRALRAAQETKTFQEAIDYVKEAVSSGWATSFKFIFGDYLEAKEWWSEIAEVMYDAFVVGGEIRNTMLSLWKEAGGRNEFLEGIRAGIENVMGLLDIFKESWREVWYGVGAEQIRNQANALVSLTKRFKEFMQALKPTEQTSENLRTILKSLFSILKTGVDIIKAIGSGLSPIAEMLNLTSGTLLELIANITSLISIKIQDFFNAERLNAITNGLKIISSILSGVIQVGLVAIFSIVERLVVGFQSFLAQVQESGGGIKGVITTLIATAKDFWNSFLEGETIANKVADTIMFIFAGLAAGVRAIISTIVGLITGELTFGDIFSGQGGVTDAVNGFSTVLDKLNLKEKIEAITNWIRDFINELVAADGIIVTFVNNLSNSLGYLYDRLKGFLDKLTISDIKDFLLIAILWQFINGINKVNLGISQVTTGFGKAIGNFNDIIESLTEDSLPRLKALTNMFNKTQPLQIGIAVTLLVAALGKLNTLDYQKTQQSVAALGVTLTMLLAAFKTLSKILNDLPKGDGKLKELAEDIFQDLAKNMMFLGASALMISQALKVLNETLFDEAGKFDLKRWAILIVNIGILTTGLAAVTRLMGSIDKGGVGNLVSLIGVAAALRLIVESVKVIAKVEDINKLAVSVGGVATIILAMGVGVRAMSSIDWKTALSTVPLMISFATSMTVMVGAIGILATLAANNSLAGALGTFVVEVSAMVGAIVVLGQALKNVKPATILSISTSMMAFSAAFLVLSGAMKLIENYNWSTSASGVTALGVSFIAMATALGILSIALDSVKSTTITTIGLAMIEFAGAIAILAVSLRMIEGIQWENIKTGVAVIGGAIAIFSAFAAAIVLLNTTLTPVVAGAIVTQLDTVATAFLKFGVAITAISAGIFLLSAATGLFAAIVGAIQAFASYFGIDLPKMVSDGFDTVELIIKEFLEMLRNLAPDLFETAVTLFGMISLAVLAVKHPTATAIVGVVLAIVDELKTHGKDILDAIVWVINFIKDAKDLFVALEDLAFTLGNFLGAALVQALCGALSGLVDGIKSCWNRWFGDTIVSAAGVTAENVNDTLSKNLLDLDDDKISERGRLAAYNSIKAMVEQYDEGKVDLDNQLVENAREAMSGFEEEVKKSSYGSVEAMAKEFQRGVKDNRKLFKKGAGDLGEGVKEGYGESLDPGKWFDWFGDTTVGKMAMNFLSGVAENIPIFKEGGFSLGDAVGSGFESALSNYTFFPTNLVVGYGKYEAPDDMFDDPDAWDSYYESEKGKKNLKAFEEAGKQAGNSYIDGIASAVSNLGGSGSKASKAAKSSAKTIADEFSDELDRINRENSIQEKLYKLWTAQNPTADEMQKNAKEIEYYTELVNKKVRLAEIAQEQYQKTLQQMGESAKETQEAYSNMLDKQMDLIEAQTKLADMQAEYAQKADDIIRTFEKQMEDRKYNYFDKDAVQKADRQYEAFMKGWEEWAPYINYLIDDFGYDITTISRALNKDLGQLEDIAPGDEVLDDIRAKMYDIIERGIGANEIKERYGWVGEEVIKNGIASGMDDSLYYLEDSVFDVQDTVIESFDADMVFSKYYQGGKYAIEGLNQGLNDSSLRSDALYSSATLGVDMYDSFNRSIGINSPSTFFAESGRMIDLGLVEGIKDGSIEAIDAVVSLAVDMLEASKDALGINSPSKKMMEIGKFYDLGFSKGISSYSGNVERSAIGMLDDLVNSSKRSIDNNQNEINDYLQRMFGLDNDQLSMTIIVDADTSKADRSLSELERIRTFGVGSQQTTSYGSDSFGRMILEQEEYRSRQIQKMYDILNGYSQKPGSMLSSEQEPSSVVNLNYTQNNTSPKALSRTEIYRDTQKQLSTFANKFGIIRRR